MTESRCKEPNLAVFLVESPSESPDFEPEDFDSVSPLSADRPGPVSREDLEDLSAPDFEGLLSDDLLSDEDELDEPESEEPVESAWATPGIATIAAPIPRAKTPAPTQPAAL
ncbi:MAG: hypothetical protein WBB07_00665 [Mycobacterium sp.]